MKFYIYFFLFFLCSFSSLAQKHDHIWYFGYDGLDEPSDTLWGRTILDFNSEDGNPLIYYNGYSYIDFHLTNVTISNEDGEFIFCHNGQYIEDASLEVMENGENVNNTSGAIGNAVPQSSLVIPPFDNNEEYLLLHEKWCGINGFGASGCFFYYSTIDMEQNNGLGAVVEKNKLLLNNDTLDTGKLIATRHANGRDWWLVNPRDNSDEYYTFLIAPEGVQLKEKQKLGDVSIGGLGQAAFSPDGKFYVITSSISESEGRYLDIFSFDRCTGKLSNPINTHFPELTESGSGVVFSPDSKLLYLLDGKDIYQFDLYSDDILESQIVVAESDGYLDSIPPNFIFKPSFFLGQLAPDGRIYINSNTTSSILHTIDKPNVRGDGCEVNQHSVQLPSVNLTLPNFPNYRLGPVDSSPCDTLGINNMPQAYYRYDQDNFEDLSIEFTDLSYYEPQTWSWDFGDGTMSQDTSPVHIYPENGIYEVCLTVSNENGEHTFCRTLHLGTTSTEETNKESVAIKIYPNPTRDIVYIVLEEELLKSTKVYTMTGQLIQEYSLLGDKAMLNLKSFPSGIYLFEIETQSGQRIWKKVFIQ